MYSANYMRTISNNINESLETIIWFAAQNGQYSVDYIVPVPEVPYIADDYKYKAEKLARELQRKGYEVSVHYEETINRSGKFKIITSIKYTLTISWK